MSRGAAELLVVVVDTGGRACWKEGRSGGGRGERDKGAARVVVTGGDLTRRRDGEVEAEGIGRRRSRARALLSCEMCAAVQEGVEGEARDREREG